MKRLNEKRMASEAKTFFLKNRGPAVTEAIEQGVPALALWTVCNAVWESDQTSERTRAVMARVMPGFEQASAEAFGKLPYPRCVEATRAAGWMVVDAFEIPDHGRKPISLITAAVTMTNTLLDTGYLVLHPGSAFEASTLDLLNDFNAAAVDPTMADIFDKAMNSGKRLSKKMVNKFQNLGFFRGLEAA